VPPGRAISASSIFSEMSASGRQWRTYVESMSGNCQPTGVHGFGRNPVTFFDASHPLCSSWDVPLGTPRSGALATALRTNSLPAFSLVVPNLCHATHSCPVSTGDAWLSRWINRIVTSPSYRQGGTAVFLTWDEGKRRIGQRVPLIVVSPATVPGTISRVRYTHYSLLRTTAQLLGVVPPGHAASATSLRTPFGL
jgi:phospholipase C